MIKSIKNILFLLCLLASLNGFAQSTTSSPYSQFGLGILQGPSLPQNRSMGGITAGLRKPGSYNNINLGNPASYSAIRLTTFDVGMFSSLSKLSKAGVSEDNFNAALSHLVFAVPVSKKSALSFGVLPYSSLGYKSRIQDQIISSTDTSNIDYVYSGDGGVSKAYLGYGFQVGKHLSFGANASYLFGKLEENRDTEFPDDYSALNVRTQRNNSVGGLSFDYGVQYFGNFSKSVKFTLGYAGTAGTKINSTGNTLTTRYSKDNLGNENTAVDTTNFIENGKMKLTLPSTHTFGFTLEKSNKWLLGADLSLGQWADYREGSQNTGLQNSLGLAVGGQLTPDITAVGSYFKLVDYRLGFKYDKTYINLNNTDIDQIAATIGFGFPLPSNRSTFYKINFGTEIGQRGTVANNLVRERYVNFYIGFTLNDLWFQRIKFD